MPKECKLTVYPLPDFRTLRYGRTTNVWGFNKKSDIGFGGTIQSWRPPERSSYTCSPDATIIGFANQNRHGNRIVLPIKGVRHRGMNIESIGIWWPLQDIDWNKNISAKMKTPPNTFISGMRNDACPGGDGYFTSKYHGSNYLECVYDKYDETRLRTLHATTSGSNDKALTFSDLKTKFCAVSENVFKNPGGGSCLEYDTSKALAKEYCSVGDRIATDGSCTSVNLGNLKKLSVKMMKDKALTKNTYTSRELTGARVNCWGYRRRRRKHLRHGSVVHFHRGGTCPWWT